MAALSNAHNWYEATATGSPQMGVGTVEGDADWFHIGALTPGDPARVSILPDFKLEYLSGTLYYVAPEVAVTAMLLQHFTVTGNVEAFFAQNADYLSSGLMFREGSSGEGVLYVAGSDTLPDQILQSQFSGAIGGVNLQTFQQVTAIVPGAHVDTYPDLYEVSYDNDFYLKADGFTIDNGLGFNFSGRYLVTTGNPTGQRNQAWGSWLDSVDLAGGSTQGPEIDDSGLTLPVPAAVQWEHPADAPAGLFESPSFVVDPESGAWSLKDLASLLPSPTDDEKDFVIGTVRDTLIDRVKDAMMDAVFSKLEDVAGEAASTKLRGLLGNVSKALDLHAVLKDNYGALLDLAMKGANGEMSFEDYDAQSTHLIDKFKTDLLGLVLPGPVMTLIRGWQVFTRNSDVSFGIKLEPGQINGSDHREFVSGSLNADKFSGGNGNDAAFGSDGNDTLSGGTGADWLLGGQGADSLIGGAGNDSLGGGAGNDKLTGGASSDNFVFDSALAANVDTILDFSHAQHDKIRLDNDVFTKLGSSATPVNLKARNFSVDGVAHDAKDFILYDPSSGKLTYDSNGSAAGGTHVFAVLGTTTHPVLVASDFQIVD